MGVRIYYESRLHNTGVGTEADTPKTENLFYYPALKSAPTQAMSAKSNWT